MENNGAKIIYRHIREYSMVKVQKAYFNPIGSLFTSFIPTERIGRYAEPTTSSIRS